MRTLLSCLAVCAAVLPARALTQEPANDEAPILVRAERLIVKPGTVLEPGQLLVRDGLIVAVGQDLEAPEGARVVEGRVVCSGFIDPWSALGVAPASIENGDADMATRAVDAVDVFDGEHLRREALEAGVTTVRVQLARNALLAGLGTVLKLAGDDRDSAILIAEAAAGASIGLSVEGGGRFVVDDQGNFTFVTGPQPADPFDRIAQVDQLASQLQAGSDYVQERVEYREELAEWEKAIAEKEKELEKDFKKAKKDREKEQKEAEEKDKEFKEKKYKEDRKPSLPKYDASREALGRIVSGELPLVVHVHRAAEIRELLEATERFGRLRLLIAGGTEALSSAEELASRRIPVIVWPALFGRSQLDSYDEYDSHSLTLAADLAAAGVPVLLGSGGEDPRATRDLPLTAALAVGHGLDREKAFAALTIDAARALDVADRVGSLEFGKDADVLVLDGEPLVSTTRVQYVIAAGEVVVSPEN